MTQNIGYRIGVEGGDKARAEIQSLATADEAMQQRRIRAAQNAAAKLDQLDRQREASAVDLARKSTAIDAGKTPGGFAAVQQGQREAAEQVRLLREQARLDAELAKRADDLRRAVDPLFASQERYNRELAEAMQLKRAGLITESTYQNSLARSRKALDDATLAANRNGVSVGQQRAGYLQLGFQIQDITQGIASRTPIFVIAAQQLGQMSSAAALLTEGMVGQKGLKGALASSLAFLGGPWGAAITGGALILATLTMASGDAAEAAKKAAEEETKRAESLRETARAAQDAMRSEFALSRARYSSAAAEETRSNQALAKSVADLGKARAKLKELESQPVPAGFQGGMQGAGYAAARLGQIDLAKAEIARLEAQTKTLRENQANASAAAVAYKAAVIRGDVEANATAQGRSTRKFALERDDAYKLLFEDIKKAEGSIILAERAWARYAQTLTGITSAENAAREAIKATNSSLNDRRSDQQAFADFQAELRKRGVVQAAGRTGFRSAADQNALFKDGLTPLDGYKAVSRHQSWRALDPTRASHNAMAAREAAQAAGLKGFEIVPESGGRWHYEWTGHGKSGEVDWRASEAAQREAMQEQKRLVDELAQSYASLVDRYDPLLSEMRDYAKVQEDINRLVMAGPGGGGISAREGNRLSIAAAVENIRRENEITGAERDDTITQDNFRDYESKQRQAIETAKRMLEADDERTQFLERQLELVGANDRERRIELTRLETILDLQRAGIDAESDRGKEIVASRLATENLALEFEKASALQQEFRRFGESTLDAIFDTRNWKDWGDLGKSILRELQAEFVKLALLNPLKNALYGSNEPTLGLGGLFGSKGIVAGDGILPKLPFKIPGFATGTESFAGGWAQVGENGKELVRLPAGSKIFGAADSSRMLAANDGARAPVVVNQTINFQGARDIATMDAVLEIAERTHHATLDAIGQRQRRAG